MGKPFVKGDPRINRSGRRKGTEDIRAALRRIGSELVEGTNVTKHDAILLNIIDGAVAGNEQKQRYYLEYYYGKPVQPVDVDASIGVAAFDAATMEFAQRFLSDGGNVDV